MKIEITYPDEIEKESIEIGPSFIEYAKGFMDLYLDFKKRTEN